MNGIRAGPVHRARFGLSVVGSGLIVGFRWLQASMAKHSSDRLFSDRPCTACTAVVRSHTSATVGRHTWHDHESMIRFGMITSELKQTASEHRTYRQLSFFIRSMVS